MNGRQVKAKAVKETKVDKIIEQAISEKLYIAEHNIAILRLILIAFNSVVYLLWVEPANAIPWLAYTIIVLANSYAALVVLFKPYERFPIIMSSYFTTISDGLLTTLWITATGCVDSPFYVIWYVSVIAVAMRYTMRDTLVTVAVYIGLYMFIIAIDTNTSISIFDAVTRMGYIPICGLLGAFFSREIADQLNDKLKTQEAENQLKNIKSELEVRVQERTAELQEKNNDITASISYAKRIQNATLPPIETIKSSFSDAFILYLPKDIISGDFYWFHHDNEGSTCYVAAVDCTGHGVPGALMSMMGADLLNQHIIEGGNLLHPSEVLQQMNNSVVKTLRQKNSTSMVNDGMEMALCKFTCVGNTKLLTFAGANRPLYIIRNGQITCYEGTRNPIGGHSENEQNGYQQIEIEIESGDLVYLFTDGFVDQFGGADNKKFLKKRFQELLVKVSNLPLELQKQSINRALQKWQGKNAQIDDILVMGLLV